MWGYIIPIFYGYGNLVYQRWKRLVFIYFYRGVKVMHILAFILMFIVGSIIAACSGDFSGLAAIGKIVGFFVLLFVMMWLFTQPTLLVVVIVMAIFILIVCSSSK